MKLHTITKTLAASILVAHTASAENETQHNLHEYGKTLCNYGQFLNSEDAKSAIQGIQSLFQPGKPLLQFPGGKHVNKVVYSHNTAQVYVCGWGIGKVTPIKKEDIDDSVKQVRKMCGGDNSSTGEVWYPDLDYSIGYGKIDEEICQPKNFRHRMGRMFGLL